MSNDVLDAALTAEGLDAEAIRRVYAALDAAMYVVRYDVERDRIRRQLAYERQRADEEKARLNAAVPYAGAIGRCQVSVPDGGRSVGSHRCTRKSKFIIRVRDDSGDGRLAVCTIHVAKNWVNRYRGSGWYESSSAVEVVEPEYQPA